MMSLLSPGSDMLAVTQTVLFDAGRWLLTGAVTLFLGYAILMLSALLFSAIAGSSSPRLPVWSSEQRNGSVEPRPVVPAQGDLGDVVATPEHTAVGAHS